MQQLSHKMQKKDTESRSTYILYKSVRERERANSVVNQLFLKKAKERFGSDRKFLNELSIQYTILCLPFSLS